jgi:hypothetical protein
VLSVDSLVKSPGFAFPVIPVEAGNQYFQYVLDAGVRRHDASATFYGFIKCRYAVDDRGSVSFSKVSGRPKNK